MENRQESQDKERAVLRGKGYICGRLLGEGAFSRVYYAEGGKGERIYACKVSGNIRMLEREARTLAGLRHPLFPEYFGLWQEAGLGFLLMEYVPGSSMEEMLIRRGGFSEEQVVRAGMELAEGLLHLHEGAEKLLFRDIKPANIMIRQDGRIKLLDFGCTCNLKERADSHAGSPGYAAPEQLCGEGALTITCDVYELGQTLKRMLGARGYVPEKSQRELRKSLMRILDACTRREPSERIPDMRGVMAALMQLAGGKGGGVKGYGTGSTPLDIIYQKNIYEPAFSK